MEKKRKLKTVKSKEAKVTVSRTILGQQTDADNKISIRPFVTETANVEARYGRTINVGNFESVRVDVFISCPCYAEEIVDAFRQASTLAKELLGKEVEKIIGDLGGGDISTMNL
jgi:hypothetical protein